MKKYFFTFGSDPRFPYGREDFVEVHAVDLPAACELFRSVFPNRPGSDCLNCADYYTDEEFDTFRSWAFGTKEPAVVLPSKD